MNISGFLYTELGYLKQLIWVLIYLVASSALATPANSIDLTQLTSQPIYPAQLLITNKNTQLSQLPLTDWQNFSAEDINQGISNSAFWLKFTVTNPSSEPFEWLIVGETSYLDNMYVYYQDINNQYQQLLLSDRQPFSSRPINHRTLAAPIVTDSQQTQTILIKAFHTKPDSISLNFRIMNKDKFQAYLAKENLLFGLFYGAIGFVILISLFAAMLLKQANAVYYALFLIFNCLFWLCLNGLGFQYIWPNNIYFHNEGFHLVYLGFTISALEFGKHFLKLKLNSPIFFYIFNAIQLIAVVGVLLRLAGLYIEILYISFICLLTLAIVMPLASLITWRKGFSYASWCFIAWVFYSAGLIFSLVSAVSSQFSWGMFPLLWLQLASILEVFFLMGAMTKWVVTLESDRKHALDLANQDPLTGLGNRRMLEAAYTEYQTQFIEHPNKFSLFMIMLDLDYFKKINDTYGHQAGDMVLKALSQQIKNNCRKQDVAIRFGGEEFAILLPLNNIDEAWQIAERIRKQFSETPTIYKKRKIHHTLCCGVAEVLSSKIQLDIDEMIRCADQALYKAKQDGRNLNYIYSKNKELTA
ncbi:sensor domain-containing diguanylate cyclase [Catenovulum sp. 2E275]|uniref:sensor domain-containing diguanylate cyclase n=1 Tax=Catenovulum sp. 2E275 TaxID=2980497 RepID=UPI0021CFE320|nr:diguanylate cyclase [Catenovulum sp. 2E275]MCU4676212.1 sensor domain-containing diguanylate cyclase [Catenovulum sp. 2E275]